MEDKKIKMEKLQKELQKVIENGRMAIFEIEVLNINNKEQDYVVCHIAISDDKVFCQRDGVSTEENKSNLIAVSSIDIEEDQNLDYHLEGLHGEVIEDICNGDLFELN